MNIKSRPEIEKQRDILDRRALTQALTDAVAGSRDPHADTAVVGAILREHLAARAGGDQAAVRGRPAGGGQRPAAGAQDHS